MNKGSQHDVEGDAGEHECALVYHVRRKRRLRGFLPLYVLLSALLLGGALWLVPIRMPAEKLPAHIGRVYYRDDRLLQFHLMQRSPLPFTLPEGVDPAAEPVGHPGLSLKRPASLLGLEPLPLYAESGDSCVLDDVDLLALPPESPSLGSVSSDAVSDSASEASGSAFSRDEAAALDASADAEATGSVISAEGAGDSDESAESADVADESVQPGEEVRP